MEPTPIQELAKRVLAQQPYLVAIAGVPGSGKTTTALRLQKLLKNACVIPMDGFHHYRKDLTEEGHRRRGAPFTFDSEKFERMLRQLKKEREGSFPDFDHKEKDPKEAAIIVSKETQYIIVQGLYLFYPEWHLNDLWDMKIWMECPLQTAMDRVARRHVQCGIEPDMLHSWKRVNSNDRLNAQDIVSKSDLSSALVIKSG